jgi:hypothetical protein
MRHGIGLDWPASPELIVTQLKESDGLRFANPLDQFPVTQGTLRNPRKRTRPPRTGSPPSA